MAQLSDGYATCLSTSPSEVRGLDGFSSRQPSNILRSEGYGFSCLEHGTLTTYIVSSASSRYLSHIAGWNFGHSREGTDRMIKVGEALPPNTNDVVELP
jgi:hypothetical protein